MPTIRLLISVLLLLCIPYNVHAQKLHLECLGLTANETATIDTLGYTNHLKTTTL